MATAQRDDPDDLEELAYVGPRTAERLAETGVSVPDVREKRVSYRDLVSAGVNSGVAAKLRREHSLHWTLDERGADLVRRSEQVRGLGDGEREWVAAARSSGGESGQEPHGATDDASGRPSEDGADWPTAANADEPPRP